MLYDKSEENKIRNKVIVALKDLGANQSINKVVDEYMVQYYLKKLKAYLKKSSAAATTTDNQDKS